jgi:hypothetical protein
LASLALEGDRVIVISEAGRLDAGREATFQGSFLAERRMQAVGRQIKKPPPSAAPISHQGGSHMGEARRRKAVLKQKENMEQAAARELAKSMWDAADKAKVDAAIHSVSGAELSPVDILVMSAGLIAQTCAPLLEQTPSEFLSGFSQLVLSLLAGHKKILADVMANAAMDGPGIDTPAPAPMEVADAV